MNESKLIINENCLLKINLNLIEFNYKLMLQKISKTTILSAVLKSNSYGLGLKRIADKKNIFVLLPNGQNITLSALQKDGAVIPAGSVIIVPPKTDKLTALGLTDIWSRVLGNIATSILAINAATQ